MRASHRRIGILSRFSRASTGIVSREQHRAPPGAAPVRCPQQAAVRRSAGEGGTGLDAHGAPRPGPPAPPRSERVKAGDAQAPRAWPIRAGAIGGGGRVGGQAAGSAAGEGVGFLG